MKNQNKLLLEILPDTISDREVPAFFSKEKLKLLKQNGIRASFIISSEPVDAKAYFFLMNILKKAALDVSSNAWKKIIKNFKKNLTKETMEVR